MKTLTASLLLTLSAFAGVTMATPYGETTDEQRSAQRSDEAVAEELGKLNAACGTKITASINWKSYASFAPADRGGRTLANIYEIASSQTTFNLRSITDGCGEKLFKDNVAKKVKSITFTPTKGDVSAKNPSHTFKLTGGVLAVNYNFQTSNTDTTEMRKLI